MATQTSREAALARRLALSTSGKSAEKRYSNGANRVRSASEARPSRTDIAAASTSLSATPAARPELATRIPISLSHSTPRTINRAALSNPSRELVLARREALSKKGKRADTSRDRTRSLPVKAASSSPIATPETTSKAKDRGEGSTSRSDARPGLSLSAPEQGSRHSSKSSKRVSAQHNPSRALVLARRDALSKRGKSATTSTPSGAAAVRQANPELSSRDLAHRIRDLRSKTGAAAVARSAGGSSGSGSARPSGPRRGKNLQAHAAAGAQDAPWKVGASETSRGQVVTGTQANRSLKTTGNEASTCRTITGTEYLGAEIFRSFCQSDPGPSQPAKVRVSATSHGNRVTGNEVGRSEKVTGDEPGTCKNVTGTEYISANQASTWCGGSTPSPRKVGVAQTQGGRKVSGVLVGRSERVTGDEHGSGINPTGTQYLGNDSLATPGQAPAKVGEVLTLRGTGVTGTLVGRSDKVTGNEPGTCKIITGDEYIGPQQYDRFCGARPGPEAAKVGFSITNRAQVVSGTRTGRSASVTGDEAGTCKSVTGTPYAGLEQASDWCSSDDLRSIRQRTPARAGTPGARLSGIQPGIGGVMTGAAKGACESITGTPYIGGDQFASACGTAAATLGVHEADFPQPLEAESSWQRFSVQSPAQVAQQTQKRSGAVTGTRYETSAKITGPFDLAGDTVTGTEQFRFDRRPSTLAAATAHAPVSVDEDARPVSRVTGEGISAGLKITGDDWDRGERVTGTEGVSARRRNPTRNGSLPGQVIHQRKRNEDLPRPSSPVTGSSGNTNQGSLITVSGGARG
ncbi:CsoS2 family carboxysome shell protein [Cyanobium sp. Morenito 9A2]|uniref:carboxysome assembly protein CsoS2 n=1 Tax=Cyanobium sp. Morenito 9A2 TaxID=2823718 RepID=UPI0020CD6647|nr:CsoS2 family carboxysome shell protein [Cyanobium sp. Morenito 9A2]MCP9849273.1 CsoS2 family carboxysome shell protein [Cyanobium sp. Morenito 9A2]